MNVYDMSWFLWCELNIIKIIYRDLKDYLYVDLYDMGDLIRIGKYWVV